MLVVNLESLLQQSHFKNEGMQEISTAGKLEKIETSSNIHEHEVLPEEAEVPNDEDGQRKQRKLLRGLIIS